MIKAAFYERTGPAAEVLHLGVRPVPQPGLGEVRVRVYASAVNPADFSLSATRKESNVMAAMTRIYLKSPTNQNWW